MAAVDCWFTPLYCLTKGISVGHTYHLLFYAAPGPPSLEELQYENFAIIVTWKEPEEKNGVITAYKVEWTEANGEEKTQETDGNTFTYQILDPSCGGEVVVTVRAMTVDLGEKSPPRSVVLVNSSKCINHQHYRRYTLEVLIQ